MQFPALKEGRLIKRYKRFLADVIVDDEMITVHCPNTGAMTGCAEPGSKVWLSLSDNPKRKYQHTWELVETAPGEMACIHSALANKLAKEAVESGVVKELAGFETLKTEVKYGEENSRCDLWLEFANSDCIVEVKSVTLHLGSGIGVFPDAVTTRGQKHLRELMAARKSGLRAVQLFCVLHTGIDSVSPADSIDPVYAGLLRDAMSAGVEVLAYRATMTFEKIQLTEKLTVLDRQGGL